jgi:hypothetical protein
MDQQSALLKKQLARRKRSPYPLAFRSDDSPCRAEIVGEEKTAPHPEDPVLVEQDRGLKLIGPIRSATHGKNQRGPLAGERRPREVFLQLRHRAALAAPAA